MGDGRSWGGIQGNAKTLGVGPGHSKFPLKKEIFGGGDKNIPLGMVLIPCWDERDRK